MDMKFQMVYEFDFVHDGQKVFRQILDAMSNPGQIKNIKEQAVKFNKEAKVLMAIGCTLLDNEVTMYVEKNQGLQNILEELTLCEKTEFEKADYIFLSSELNYGSITEMMKNCKRGTYEDPQQSALFILLCDSFNEETTMTLTGPGIDNRLTIKTGEYIKNIITIRQGLYMEYPLGIDLLFVDKEGNLLGIPRLCNIEEDQEV